MLRLSTPTFLGGHGAHAQLHTCGGGACEASTGAQLRGLYTWLAHAETGASTRLLLQALNASPPTARHQTYVRGPTSLTQKAAESHGNTEPAARLPRSTPRQASRTRTPQPTGTGQTRQGRRCPGRPHCLGFFLDADRRRTCCRADCRRLCPSTDDLALLEQKHVLSLSLVWELYSSLDTFCSSL